MTIPLQFASLYEDHEVMWSDCLLDLGTDFLVGHMVLYEMRSILRWRVISLACILLWNSAVRVHDSQEDGCDKGAHQTRQDTSRR